MTRKLSVFIFFGVFALSALLSKSHAQTDFSTIANARMEMLYGNQGGCPTGSYNTAEFGNTPSCAKVVGKPVCRQTGWVVAANGECYPPQAIPEPAICESGQLTLLAVGLGTGCVVQYQSIPNGSPLPSAYNRCMAEGRGNNRYISPDVWCAQTLQNSGKPVNETTVQQCMQSGQGSGHLMEPETYCQMIASEIWNQPNYSGLNQIWVEK